MWQSMFEFQIPALEKIIRTIVVYFAIVIIFRVSTGKRSLASMNTLDFVVLFLLSNVVQNAIIGDDNSLVGGLLGAVTLVVANELVDRLAYGSTWFRRLVEGRSVPIITKGRLNHKNLRRLGIRPAELDHAVRVQNGDDVSEVWTGVVESNGQLVLTLKADDQGASAGDIAELRERLVRIEALLTSAGPRQGQ